MLIEQANYYGGQDNITVIVVDVNSSVVKHKKAARKSRLRAYLIVLLTLLILGGAGAAVYGIINNSAYLIEEEGYVSIYKGLPGRVAGISFSEKDYGSDVWVKDLRQTTQDHLNEGPIRVSSLDEAYHVLDNYKEEAKEFKDKKSKNTDNNNNKQEDNTKKTN